MKPKKILVVDDSDLMHRMYGMMLRDGGLVAARDGDEAVAAIVADPGIDLVLLDMHMPVMDGPTTIAKIRASNRPWAATPVIALTADAMSGDREKYLALGMTDYVSKPVDQRELIAKMHQVLGLETPMAQVRSA